MTKQQDHAERIGKNCHTGGHNSSYRNSRYSETGQLVGSRTCKPNSVCGIAPGRTVIPLGHALLRGSSDLPGGCNAPSRHVQAKLLLRPGSLPIWSCSVWGLPCPLHYCGGGALLPHLFTLTSLPRRYVLCGTSRQPGLNPASRTLSGTLLCGVRTFLPRSLTKQERPSGPAAYPVIICDRAEGRCSLSYIPS